MESLFQDLRYGIRTLLKSGSFTAAAVLSLAVGIGANSTIFSVVNGILLRPLPVKDSDQLVALASVDHHTFGYPHGLSYPDYLDFRGRSDVFAGLIAYSPASLSLSSSGGENERAWGIVASGNYGVIAYSVSQRTHEIASAWPSGPAKPMCSSWS